VSLAVEDRVDCALLDLLQTEIPLVPRPFLELGEMLGISEEEVLGRVGALKEEGLIRQISAIFDTRRLGYHSTLATFHVPDRALEVVGKRVSAHPGVSHCYARPHFYNLWFTLAVPPGLELGHELISLAEASDISDWLNLPAERVFKIKTHFSMEEEFAPNGEGPEEVAPCRRAFRPADVAYVRVLQRDLPLVPRPFAKAARELNVSEEALLERARELEAAGILRRFSGVLRHRQAGYRANGMACWVVPEARIDEVGRRAAEFPEVSHCYQRPAHPPRWPYILFTMIHGQTREDVQAVVSSIVEATGIERYEVLYSTREFKKERVQYFCLDS
jgi:DNA-binding Lrp family transcriptional regulator